MGSQLMEAAKGTSSDVPFLLGTIIMEDRRLCRVQISVSLQNLPKDDSLFILKAAPGDCVYSPNSLNELQAFAHFPITTIIKKIADRLHADERRLIQSDRRF